MGGVDTSRLIGNPKREKGKKIVTAYCLACTCSVLPPSSRISESLDSFGVFREERPGRRQLIGAEGRGSAPSGSVRLAIPERRLHTIGSGAGYSQP